MFVFVYDNYKGIFSLRLKGMVFFSRIPRSIHIMVLFNLPFRTRAVSESDVVKCDVTKIRGSSDRFKHNLKKIEKTNKNIYF